ncbi:MAG: tRNA pseudouridine(55) synthase TruB [Bacillota bacterium]|nr:MAG: tRNA pseudouridine(55) synthase TruB [Bacillota bacterium]
MDGFLLINKPVGMTSHDVVYKVKRKLHIDKIGHTGTLDPFASGLLILCLGKATKLQSLFLNADKVYEGTIILGKHYDTYDHTGHVIATDDKIIDEAKLRLTIQEMNQTYMQYPPMYSAKKHEGRKLYQIARKGETVQVEPREVNIYTFKITSPYIDHAFDFYAHVSKGTYIRSLAVDLAEKLGTYGALSRLNRIKIATYDVSQAKTIEEVEISDMISLETYFKDEPVIVLTDYMCKLVQNGVYLDERQTTINQNFIVKNELGHMIAYYEVIGENTYRPYVIF